MATTEGGNNVEGGGSVEAVSEISTVLYDRTGAIKHIHHNVTLRGGHELTEDEMAAAATDVLRRQQRPVDGLQAIHVPTSTLEPRKRYRVDTQKRIVVDQT
jgi:hypothetical protein